MKMEKKKTLNNFETKCDDEVNIIGVSISKKVYRKWQQQKKSWLCQHWQFKRDSYHH